MFASEMHASMAGLVVLRCQGWGGLSTHPRRHRSKDCAGGFISLLMLCENAQNSPLLTDFPDWLLPGAHETHGNPKMKMTLHSRTVSALQVNERPGTPQQDQRISPKDGHYFIHPDPLQAGLTVARGSPCRPFPTTTSCCPRTERLQKSEGKPVPPSGTEIAKVVHGCLRKKLVGRWSCRHGQDFDRRRRAGTCHASNPGTHEA